MIIIKPHFKILELSVISIVNSLVSRQVTLEWVPPPSQQSRDTVIELSGAS